MGNFVPVFRDHVEHDRDLLHEIGKRLEELGGRPDPKLGLLRRILRDSPSDKIVVFSTFADTVRYLDKHLPEDVDGRARVAIIGAETSPDERTNLLLRFCPESVSGTASYRPRDGEVDLLLSNDVLSEGQDLQQAGAVVSYDMPWNPQRMVQRYGRVIRLKSPHDTVHLTTMLPEPGDLEEILRLEIAIVARSSRRVPTASRSMSSTGPRRRRGPTPSGWRTRTHRSSTRTRGPGARPPSPENPSGPIFGASWRRDGARS